MSAKKYLKLVVGAGMILGGIAMVTTGFIGFVIPEPASSILGFLIMGIGFFIFLFGLGLFGIKTGKISEEAGKGADELKNVAGVDDIELLEGA